MSFEETKEEQNQTISRVPLDIWADFKTECARERVSMTKGFIESFKLWRTNNEQNKKRI
jgi:hypothetical protein